MAFTRTKIMTRIRRAGARYLEAMAYADASGLVYYPANTSGLVYYPADASGLVYYPAGPIAACIPVRATEPEHVSAEAGPAADGGEPAAA